MGDVGAQHRNSLPHQRHTHTTHIHIEQPAQSHGIQCTAPQLQSQYPLQQRHYDALNYYLGLERIRYGMCEMAFIGIQYGFMYVIWEKIQCPWMTFTAVNSCISSSDIISRSKSLCKTVKWRYSIHKMVKWLTWNMRIRFTSCQRPIAQRTHVNASKRIMFTHQQHL